MNSLWHTKCVDRANKLESNYVVSCGTHYYWFKLDEESQIIIPYLKKINMLNFLTTSSQPTVIQGNVKGASWPDQRAYVSGVMNRSHCQRLKAHIMENYPFILCGHDLSSEKPIPLTKDKNGTEKVYSWGGRMSMDIYQYVYNVSVENLNIDLIIVEFIDEEWERHDFKFWEAIIDGLQKTIDKE